jgi:hypothetical protein
MEEGRALTAREQSSATDHDGAQPQRRQELIRAVNEEIEHLNEQWDGTAGVIVVYCECGSASCQEQIELPNQVYVSVRSNAQRFVVKPGHETPGSDWILEDDLTYYIAERRGSSAAPEPSP